MKTLGMLAGLAMVVLLSILAVSLSGCCNLGGGTMVCSAPFARSCTIKDAVGANVSTVDADRAVAHAADQRQSTDKTAFARTTDAAAATDQGAAANKPGGTATADGARDKTTTLSVPVSAVPGSTAASAATSALSALASKAATAKSAAVASPVAKDSK